MSAQPTYGNAIDEWKETRAVMARFDENLHDLRKYGFSFVTPFWPPMACSVKEAKLLFLTALEQASS